MAEVVSEQERLEALRALTILDTAAEPEFDDLVSLASAICGVPISMISLIDSDRQWFKAARGTTLRETPRSTAFCDHAIRQTELFVVPDARDDARFMDNPLVSGDEAWRFYAGFPLRVTGGHAIGTLCVVDRQPKLLTEQQNEALRVLADQVVARLELRASRKLLEEAQAVKERALQEAHQAERRFRMFMNNGPFISYMKDSDGRMLYYNQPLAKQFAVSEEELLGKTDAELWPADLAKEYREHDLRVLTSGRLEISEERTKNPDESYSTWRSYKFSCPQEGGRPLLGGVSIDITDQLARENELVRMQKELRQVNLLLEELASKDALTGLTIRRVFEEQVRKSFRESRRDGRPMCLLFIDIDNFKRHNDSFGHQHGDDVLKAVATALAGQLRPTDLIARFGGEEFAIAALGTASAGATILAERLLSVVRSLIITAHAVTVSIGVAEMRNDETAKELLARADQALYTAKRSGKDRAVLWSQDGLVE